MAKRRQPPEDIDSPWKDALHHYLRAFLAFFFADIHADIDWSRGYESLDKEFQQIVRRAKVGKRLADKLFKVWLRDGAEHWQNWRQSVCRGRAGATGSDGDAR
jgi:hypothetical protein